MGSRKYKIDDRVKRVSGEGCHGIVKEVREEAVASKVESPEKGPLINVLWDNGTLSYLSPEALAPLSE